MARVTTMLVNIEASSPMMRVVANPRTGPAPYARMTKPATSAVTWPSKIVQKTLS